VGEQAQGRSLALTAQAGDQVRALGGAPEQLALQAGLGEQGGEVLLGGALVAGGIDRVEPDQPLQQ